MSGRSPPPRPTQAGSSTETPTSCPRPSSLFKRSPRPLALAAAYEDLGLAQQQQGMSDSGADAFDPVPWSFSRAPGRPAMQRDSEALCEGSGSAVGW